MAPSILVVDDDPSTRSLLQRVLTTHGYTVAVAPDGESALAAVDVQLPGLVMADLVMPRLDGVAMIARLRQHHPHLPIIALSAANGVPELGSVPFLAKPFALTTLLELVQDLLPVLS